jgi:hypothetical protein
MNMRLSINLTHASILTFALSLSACGGGGDSGSTGPLPRQGVFLDSAVSGLTYTCGDKTGTTDANGTFSFKDGERCSFKVGDIALGETTGSAVITPVSLVNGATSETNLQASNIARLLQTLDADGNPSNGITISDTTKSVLQNSALDFASANFASNAQTLVTLVDRTKTLVSDVAAQAHLRSSILSQIAGTYRCTYGGSDSGSGTATLTTNGTLGIITGSGSSRDDGSGTFSGAFNSSGQATFAFGSVSSGATFTGKFGVDGSASGSWQNGTFTGTWQCTKV